MRRLLTFASLLLMGGVCMAGTAFDSPEDSDQAANSAATTPDADIGHNAGSSSEGGLSRWFELDALSMTLRYRNSFDTEGARIFDDVQQKSLIRGKVKLDRDGKYFVGFRAESGRYFNWSFANISGLDYHQGINVAVPQFYPVRASLVNTAVAADPQAATVLANIQARGWEFYIRDLYLSATPIKGLTVEFGAIPIERGFGTEITTFDDDGYISGERLRVDDSKHFYFSEISFTSAYLGDVFTPNFFDRYDRLTQSNYRQLMFQKNLGKRLKASVDYTWLIGTNTIREAALVNVKETRFLDTARIELYQRTNDVQLPGYLTKAADGWAFTGSRKFRKRAVVEGGFASVDDDYGVYSGSSILTAANFSINGDSYQVGKRFFGKTSIKIAPYASLFGFYTHDLDAKPNDLHFSWTRQNYNFGLELDFKALANAAHVL